MVRNVPVEAGRLERWVAGFGERHPGVRATVWADRVLLSAPDGSAAELFAPFPPLVELAVEPLTASGGPRGPEPVEPLTASGGRRGPEPADPVAAGPLLAEPGSWEPFELAGPPPGQLPPDPPLHPLGQAGPAQAAAALVANAHSVPGLRVLLIRRGGYACAVLAGDTVTSSKIGSRYVQGRTAAGGWSQQRFARRRDGQAQALVGSATEVAVRVLLPAGPDDALVTGGDRPLIDQVLADPRLAGLNRLRRGPQLDIGDPRIDLVQELPRTARAIRITLDER